MLVKQLPAPGLKTVFGNFFRNFFVDLHLINFAEMLKKIVLVSVLAATVQLAAAVDFRLTDWNGSDCRLSDFGGGCTLLFLYNSECGLCSESAALIEESAALRAIPDLTVVSVAMFEDGSGWKNKALDFPDAWKNCCDTYWEIAEGGTLEFSSVPAFFILDGDGNVLSGSSSFGDLEDFVNGESNRKKILSE